jgi:hypothetical protein
MTDPSMKRTDMQSIPSTRPIDKFQENRLPNFSALQRYRGDYIYFIDAQPSGLIKIGISADVAGRFMALQNATGEELRIIGKFPGNAEMERHLHELFHTSRVRREWFSPSPGLVKFITELFPHNYPIQFSKTKRYRTKVLTPEIRATIKARLVSEIAYGDMARIAAEYNISRAYAALLKREAING